MQTMSSNERALKLQSQVYHFSEKQQITQAAVEF